MTESNPMRVRATALAGSEPGDAPVVLHPDDLIFDLPAFNRMEAKHYRALPAESLNGLPCEALARYRHLLVDHHLLESNHLIMWSQNGERVPLGVQGIRRARVIDACVSLPCTDDTRSDRERINQTITSFTARRIRQRLDETLEIPPLPTAAQKIVALRSNPDYTLADLVKIVETDPAIAAQVMSWACSAFYAADPPPKSLSDAIMRVLGFDMVMNLALGLALAGSLRLPEQEIRGVPAFWTEAVFTAAAMEALSGRQRGADRSQAGLNYLIGLLANFGTLVVGHVFPPQYAQICSLQEANPQHPVHLLDEHVLSVGREVIGAELLDQWGLPTPLVQAVRHQNDVDYLGPFEESVYLLRAAKAMLGYGANALIDVEDQTLSSIGIEREDILDVSSLLSDSHAALEGIVRAVA
ncbi:MAG: HDOD domain-containing protein [Pseudomonadales bacterium]|nr:HDOD domain-containing protein [Pseudomonadales bacterium]MCP5183454.1 HDOD domain-containing protein [Pseudomonadales bacterium]